MKVSIKLDTSSACKYYNCPKDWDRGIEDARIENWRGCFPKREECNKCDYENGWQQYIRQPFREEEESQSACPLKVGVN